MKICSKCGITKDLTEFQFRKEQNNYRSYCKKCKSKQDNNYYAKNKNEHLRKSKIYQKNKKEKISEQRAEYRKNNKYKIKESNKEYREKNRNILNIKDNEYQKKRRKVDPSFKLRQLISRSVYDVLKDKGTSKGTSKGGSIKDFVPFSFEQLKSHLEFLFEDWMSWENHGKFDPKSWDENDKSTWTWNLDHIIPHSTFKYESMDCDNFRACWSLSNLRPYSSKLNLLEGAGKWRHTKP